MDIKQFMMQKRQKIFPTSPSSLLGCFDKLLGLKKKLQENPIVNKVTKINFNLTKFGINYDGKTCERGSKINYKQIKTILK